MEEDSKMSVNSHSEEGNRPARPRFQTMGTFTLLVQSFLPMNKATCSVRAQMAVKCNSPLVSNASYYE